MMESVIYFSGNITDDSANRFNAAVLAAIGQDIDRLHIALCSSGGSVMAGMSMYNILRSCPFETVTHNISYVGSVANAVFLGGKRRQACATSTFMFHGVAIGVAAGNMDERMLRNGLDMIVADQQRISAVLSEHSSMKSAEVMKLFRTQTTKTAQWALDKKIVDTVADFVLPAGAPVHYVL